MKIFLGILGVIGLACLVVWGARKVSAFYANKDNARDKDERTANTQGQAKQEAAASAYADILPPMASWVRPNGAIIDLNPIGGSLPSLVTLPWYPSSGATG